MSVAELSDPEAVRKAIEEYDSVGRDAFLKKYGFGRARSYWLVHDDKRYDSKAIVGAAFGYQFPDRGPLSSEDFSGGESRVQPVLERLGFTVDASPPLTSEQLTAWVGSLSVASLANARTAPHKPLLLLIALRNFATGQPRLRPPNEYAAELGDLLKRALPEVSSPSPWEPIWRLDSRLWELGVGDGDLREREGAPDAPPVQELQSPGVLCGLTEPVNALLVASPGLVEQLQRQIVDQYLEGISDDVITEASGGGTSSGLVWWVNQGRTYLQERTAVTFGRQRSRRLAGRLPTTRPLVSSSLGTFSSTTAVGRSRPSGWCACCPRFPLGLTSCLMNSGARRGTGPKCSTSSS